MQEADNHFAAFCWSFTDGKPIPGLGYSTETELSRTISKALKKRDFKFVGPTIVYAWMQAVGIVNDHSPFCFRRHELEVTVAAFQARGVRCSEAKRRTRADLESSADRRAVPPHLYRARPCGRQRR
jgi:hypothetical protein